jgi:hypothetical protein
LPFQFISSILLPLSDKKYECLFDLICSFTD